MSDTIEGHWVRLTYSENKFTIRNDRLGLRSLYWLTTPSAIIISSRLDWISKYACGLKIDFPNLGSRWLLFNQLTYDCPIEGVKRLGPGGKLEIANGVTRYSDSPFLPTPGRKYEPEKIVERLRRYATPAMGENLCASLGLSGGLDSRVLLSLLLTSNTQKFTTHTFGNNADPDVSIPQRISRELRIPHVVYDAQIPSVSEVIALFRDYIAQTNLVEPISTVLRLRHYHGLDQNSQFLIDGGFGEVARRQYLNRLMLNGAKAIENRSIAVIRNSLRAHRGGIFNDDVNQVMLAGADREIMQMLESMPPLSSMNIEDYLDLWAVRTRIPNFSSDEQARMDSTIVNYMPFAQPGFIDDVFTMPLRYRRNGAFLRSLIGSLCAPLKRYPLVKNNTTYPFILPTYGAWIWSKAKARFGHQYRDESTHVFLHSIQEYVMDVLHSQDTKQYAPYDYPIIQKNVTEYYRGNRSLSNQVNWWLSFDLWRRNFT
ncbi:MAG TPA: hypothetical protein VK470_06680 [Bacteroidota bacterium]|nr:hypothetical protein [Bacteroidota bacterium]